MSFRPGTTRKGRPNEIGQDGSGYAPNGESEFSRVAANGSSNSRLATAKPARIRAGRKLPLHDLITEYAGRVQWIEAELRTETVAARRDKLTKQLAFKTQRLADLRRELEG